MQRARPARRGSSSTTSAAAACPRRARSSRSRRAPPPRDVEKVLKSAVANAESNPNLRWDGDDLVVSAVYVDEGPTLKRWRQRARGRVNQILKRTCHITIKLEQARGQPGCGRRRARSAAARRRRRPRPTATTPAQEEGGGRLMGQKVHPGGLRVGVIHDWKSNWMVPTRSSPARCSRTSRSASTSSSKLSHAGLSDILIRKDKQRITIDIYTARPGIVIGKSGVEVDALRKEVHALTTEERPHQHQRDQAPRARREARRAVDRRAAAEPRLVPPRDEALARLGDPLGRRRA